MQNEKEDDIEKYKQNMQEVEDPGSYVFLIFPLCTGIFIISLFVFLAVMAFSDPLLEGYELMGLGILLIIFIPLMLIIVFISLRYYTIDGRKIFLISNERLLIKVPLKAMMEIKWSDFDELLIATRKNLGKEYTILEIQFLRQVKFNKIKKVKYRLYKSEILKKVIDLMYSYATSKNVLVKIDRKDFL